MRSDAWALGIARNDVVSGGDRLSLSLSQPLRVSAGRAEINAPTGRTDTGTVLRESGSRQPDSDPAARSTWNWPTASH